MPVCLSDFQPQVCAAVSHVNIIGQQVVSQGIPPGSAAFLTGELEPLWRAVRVVGDRETAMVPQILSLYVIPAYPSVQVGSVCSRTVQVEATPL